MPKATFAKKRAPAPLSEKHFQQTAALAAKAELPSCRRVSRTPPKESVSIRLLKATADRARQYTDPMRGVKLSQVLNNAILSGLDEFDKAGGIELRITRKQNAA